MDNFCIIAFRSRQHALYFSKILKQNGYESQIISTPKGISIGCGLSLRFSPHQINKVMEVYKHNKVPIIGFYQIKQSGNIRELKRIPCNL